jgi:hypothetical protein
MALFADAALVEGDIWTDLIGRANGHFGFVFRRAREFLFGFEFALFFRRERRARVPVPVAWFLLHVKKVERLVESATRARDFLDRVRCNSLAFVRIRVHSWFEIE